MYESAPWLAHYGDIPAFLNYPDISMHQLIWRAGQISPSACACSFYGKTISYKTLLGRIDLAARALTALGIGRGDRVSICMPNTPQAIECFYALNRIGAIACMAHPLCAPEELRKNLKGSKSKLVLTLDRHFDKVYEATQRLSFPCTVLTATVRQALPLCKKLLFPFGKEGKQTPRLPVTGHIPWEALIQLDKGKPLPQDTGRGQDCAAILYSGGTTGAPKGVMLSNLNFNALAMQTAAVCGFKDFIGKKMLSLMPVFHGFGLGIGIHTPLSVGAACILMPQFDKGHFSHILKKQKPNVIPGVPRLFSALLELPGLNKADLSFLMGLFSGGDSLTPSLKAQVDGFLKLHGCNEQLREGYGLTECVSATCLMPRFSTRKGSVGIPFPDTMYGIFRVGTQTPAEPGEAGEICISGPTVMLGYLDDPEETAKALQTHPDGRLWLHTGDLGHMDADGFLYFHQRLKRMIVSNGYNIYPSQLEKALESHNAVLQACVVGRLDERKGQVPVAYVVLKPGVDPDDGLRQVLFDHCARHIAAYAMPRQIEFLAALPKTKLGKIDYHTLEERL